MNSNPTPPPSLDDVLEQYVAEGPSYDVLNEYVRRYPEYREELAELTVQWSAMDHAEIEMTADDDPVAQAAIEAVLNRLRQETETSPEADELVKPATSLSLVSPAGGASSVPADSLESLLERGGIDIFDFEKRSGLGYSILVNLSAGGFSFASDEERLCVARGLLQHIRSFDPDRAPPLLAVEGSISRPTQATAGANLSPHGKPGATTKPFRRGIEDALDMTPDSKATWLRLLDEAC